MLNAFTSSCDLYRAKLFCLIIGAIDDFIGSFSESALIAIPAISVAVIFPIVFFLAERGTEFGIDKNVIFRKILSYKELTVSLLASSIVLVLNNKALSVAANVFVIIYTIKALRLSYYWICAFDEKNNNRLSFRQKLRLNYLRSLENRREVFENWGLVLSDEKLGEKNQAGLISVFIETYNKLGNTIDDWSGSEFVNILSKNIEKINFYDKESYEELLRFSLKFYELKQERKDNKEIFPPFVLHDLFIKVMRCSLEEKDGPNYLTNRFFEITESYIENNPKVDESKFLKVFLIDFLCELEKIDVDIYGIWNYDFFRNRRVTRQALQDKATRKNAVAVYESLYHYVRRYALDYDEKRPRIISILEKSVENLLPECDPVFWFDIFTLTHRAFVKIENESTYYSMIVYWCKTGRSYGLMGRVFNISRSFYADDYNVEQSKESVKKKYEEKGLAEIKEACYLVGVIDRWLWNPDELKKLRDAIDKIRKDKVFKEENNEAYRLDDLESHIKALQDFVKQETKNAKH